MNWFSRSLAREYLSAVSIFSSGAISSAFFPQEKILLGNSEPGEVGNDADRIAIERLNQLLGDGEAMKSAVFLLTRGLAFRSRGLVLRTGARMEERNKGVAGDVEQPGLEAIVTCEHPLIEGRSQTSEVLPGGGT